MALILSIETATKVCSVALALHGKTIACREAKTEKFSHAENLNIFIENLWESTRYSLSDVEAIAISMGPGSYTGLRIGVSTAKGLAYGLKIPVIGIGSLDSLANLVTTEKWICPMFDARRMEVYTAMYNANLEQIKSVEAKVIDNSSFISVLEKEQVLFLGPGAEKCAKTITHHNAEFDLQTEVSALGMISLAEEKFQNEDFEDLAYFEPYYLKDFIAGKPKQLL